MDRAKILEAKEFAMRFIESVENHNELLINLIKEDVHPDNMTDEMGMDYIERREEMEKAAYSLMLTLALALATGHIQKEAAVACNKALLKLQKKKG